MKVTYNLANELVGIDILEAIFILDKLKGTGFDYPEMHISHLREWYKKESTTETNSKSE